MTNEFEGKVTTMEAIVQDTYRSPDVLQLREIDEPVVSDDEVLVRVRAAGVARDRAND